MNCDTEIMLEGTIRQSVIVYFDMTNLDAQPQNFESFEKYYWEVLQEIENNKEYYFRDSDVEDIKIGTWMNGFFAYYCEVKGVTESNKTSPK